MIETLAIITVTEETQNYGPETRRFKLEYMSDPEPKSSGDTDPVLRLEARAGSGYAYRESVSLRAIGELCDGESWQAEHDEILNVALREIRNRIKTYIDGEINTMDTETRTHHTDLQAEMP